jgi:hypothetical protein
MLKHALFVMSFALMVGGCASDGQMESSGSSSSMSSGGAPAKSSPTTSSAAAAESKSMSQSSSQNRIAAGVEEETLDTCLGRIPKDATAGQKMLAEQTCRRDYAPRR